MENTEAVAFRVSKQEGTALKKMADRHGKKVGTFMRDLVPFLIKHSYLLHVSEGFLSSFEAIVKNRNILQTLEGQSLTAEQLQESGVQLHVHTGIQVVNGLQVVSCADYELVYENESFTINQKKWN